MHENSDRKPRKPYADADQEVSGKSIDLQEKAKDAQELCQLAEEFNQGVADDQLMTP